ncbi:MAG: hypothetical protein RBS80_27415 [Thermoguttaceae bacterium]|jgi:hypothetical protein|nr:hypothetical protein [Thermoguttaceae bacterium]
MKKKSKGSVMNGPARSIPDVVADVLAEIGIAADSLLRTILIQDGYLLGEKYAFDGGYVIWMANCNRVKVFKDDGTLLKMVVVEDETDTAA